MFSSLVCYGKGENMVDKLTKGKYNNIYYFSKRWFLCKTEDGERVDEDMTPFAYAFSLSTYENDKSTSYPHVWTVVFDEFITRDSYLRDEFVIFENVLSTIIRQRRGVQIYMLGNTVNKFCPYFKEMGLKHVSGMEPGTIDLYTYGDTGLTVAVEYTKPTPKKYKQSNVYFAFDNPKLKMIQTGEWEIDIYPHCPIKYKPKDILFTYFILFEDATLQCEIISNGNNLFTYIHIKTSELKDTEKDLIYSLEYSSKPNWRRKLLYDESKIGRKIQWFYDNDKVFYQDNEVGELVRNYLQQCLK